MEILGGSPTPGMGFGSGIERIIIEMQRCGVTFDEKALADVYIVHRAEGASAAVFGLASRLRNTGISAIVGETNKSMKAQMRGANSSAARFAVIIGDDELRAGTAMLKDLGSEGQQEAVPLSRVPTLISERLRG